MTGLRIFMYHWIPKGEDSLHSIVGCSCSPEKITENGASQIVIHKYINGEKRNEKVQEDFKVWKLSAFK